jgi:hypothetical protein
MRAVLPALAVLCFSSGVWLFLPLIEEEHKRLELPLVIGLWAGDCVAVFWCLHYIAKSVLQGDSREDRMVGFKPALRQWILVSTTLLAGILVDAAVTAFAMAQEWTAFQTAARTKGEIYKLEEKRFPHNTRYRLHCRFQDQAGGRYTFICTARHERAGEFVPPLDQATQAAIQRRALPQWVSVSYDPTWPNRSWITESGWRWDEYAYGYRFQGISVVVLFFQGLVLPLFLVALWVQGKQGVLPWWSTFHQVMPLLIEGVVLVLFGLIYRYTAA